MLSNFRINFNFQKDYIVILLINSMKNEELIINRLDALKQDMNFVKEHIIDVTLTQDDINSLNEAEEEFKEGRTTPLKDLKKELGL